MLATDKLPERLRVVLLDPDPAALRWLTARLGELAHRRFDVRACTDADQALQALAERPADLLLLEHDLADGTAGDLLQVLAALRCEVPAIVVARRDGSRAAVTALAAGACDFLPKAGLTAWQLDAALERALQRARQQRRLERHRRAVELQQRELQRRNEELRSSLGVLTEALAEPLAALRTFLGELTLGELDGKQRSALDRAAAGCAGLGSLIDLLGEERAEQAAVDPSEAVTPSDLRGLLERARADAGRIARGATIVAAAGGHGDEAHFGDRDPLEVLVPARSTERALGAVFEFACGLAADSGGEASTATAVVVRIGDDTDGAFACWDVPMQPDAAAQLAADLLAPSPGVAADESSRARRTTWLRALPLRSALRTLHRAGGELHATAGAGGLRLSLRLPTARVGV